MVRGLSPRSGFSAGFLSGEVLIHLDGISGGLHRTCRARGGRGLGLVHGLCRLLGLSREH